MQTPRHRTRRHFVDVMSLVYVNCYIVFTVNMATAFTATLERCEYCFSVSETSHQNEETQSQWTTGGRMRRIVDAKGERSLGYGIMDK